MGQSLKDLSEMEIHHTSKCVVTPATPTLDHFLSLSNLDRIQNPTFASVIFFYADVLERSNRTFAEIVQTLKGSLALALVEFYPFAGRLVSGDDGLMELHCNDQGAVVIEAAVDAKLIEFGQPQPMPALSGLEFAGLGSGPRYVPHQDQLQSVPTLVIQVTHFKKCGSIAVVVNWHHTVADGASASHFIRSWSELALGKEVSLKPDHNRQLLAPRTPLDSSMFRSFSDTSTRVLATSIDSQPLAQPPSDPVVLQTFSLAKKAILNIKAQVRTETCEYTSIESVSGRLWKVMIKARAEVNDSSNHGSRSQSTKFTMFVEGRKKLGLSAGYFGNVVCPACAKGDEGEIATKSSAHATKLVKEVTRSISEEYFRSLIDWVEEHARSPPKPDYLRSLGRDVAATFWTRFALYELDLGWGRPNFAAMNLKPRPLIDGIAMMPSPEGNGDMVAIINLHASRMAKLKEDPEFAQLLATSSKNPQHSEEYFLKETSGTLSANKAVIVSDVESLSVSLTAAAGHLSSLLNRSGLQASSLLDLPLHSKAACNYKALEVC